MSPTAAAAFAATMAGHGVDRAFCVAGESYLPLLDALLDLPEVDVVTCRHEGSAAFMAVADAKLSGRAAVCLVNRGPGAANACIGVHTALLDATPLVLVVGGVRTAEVGREAFQELDCVRLFGGLVKGVWEVRDARRAAEVCARALRAAEAGTPGPAVVVVPEDVWAQPAGDLPRPGRWRPPAAAPDPAGLEQVGRLLAAASRPLLIAGSGAGSAEGRRLLRAAAERHLLPVAASCKRQDVFDNSHALYAGHLHHGTGEAQRRLLGEADLVIAVGSRLDHVTTRAGTFPAAPVPRQPLVHVHPDPLRLGSVHQPAVGLACDPAAFLRWLAAAGPQQAPAGRAEWTDALHRTEAVEATWRAHPADDGIAFGAVAAAADRLLPAGAVMTIDAGNFTGWVHRYVRCTAGRRLLGVASSAMGFGLPAGVAAAIREPGRQVVAFVGDGGFLMNGGELATAAARGARLAVIVANNGSYGTIRQHQERQYPGRVIATDLANPDFAALATAHGALGLRCADEDAVATALERALDHPGVAVVDVRTSLEWISANGRLAGIRARPGPIADPVGGAR